MEKRLLVIENAQDIGARLDKVITAHWGADYSRARLQSLIKEDAVKLNGLPAKRASTKLEAGDIIALDVPALVEAAPQPQDIPLDVAYEDDDLLVINKPAGLVVHPGAGNHDGTLVNALLHHCGDSLSGIGGVLRPGIVHRLDKETSGLIIVAKNDKAHRGLSAQLADRSLSRVYHALVLKIPVPPMGRIDMPLGRDPRNRQKMTIRRQGGKEAVTNYKMLHDYGGQFALVECKLQTGRTHQIRVHMQALGNPLIGDPAYGPQPTAVNAALKRAGLEAQILMNFPRQALHAHEISFIHPGNGETMKFTASYPADFADLIASLEK